VFVTRVDYKDVHCPWADLDAEMAGLNRQTHETSPLYSVLVTYGNMMSHLLFAGTLKLRGLFKYSLYDKREKKNILYLA
jgi:hypothetical protein